MEINANTEVKAGLETNHILDLSDRLYKIMLAIIALAALYVVGQMAYSFRSLPQNFPREISVTGEGKAYVKPDVALVSLGITTRAARSQDAVNENNTKMTEVIKAIKELGVEEQDIQTTLYNLSPVYGQSVVAPLPDRAGVVYPSPAPSNRITGYSLDQQVQVKIRNFDNVNKVLDAATSKGANMAGSLQFTVDDTEKTRAEAREKAIAQAKEKAVLLFNQSGLKMGELINVYDSNFGGCGYGPCPAYGMGAGGVADVKASVAPEIQPGQAEIVSNVTLTYRIR